MNRIKGGFFVTFEALDRAGKSTQVKLLYDHLKKEGYDVEACREPGSSHLAELIRRILLDPRIKRSEDFPLSHFLLFSAARCELYGGAIRPALKKGKVVIDDRCIDSSDAYQGHGEGLDLERMHKVHDWVLNGRWPDITFFIDMHPKNYKRGARKVHEFGRKDRYERKTDDFRMKVYNGYKENLRKYPERIKAIPYIFGEVDEMHKMIVRKFHEAYDRKLKEMK